jgi:hypothetical protein
MIIKQKARGSYITVLAYYRSTVFYVLWRCRVAAGEMSDVIAAGGLPAAAGVRGLAKPPTTIH